MVKKISVRGFTLAEVLVTLAIYTFIMGATAKIVVTLVQQASLRQSALSTTDQVRLVGIKFANELRNAQTGNDGSYAIGQASTTQFIFFSSFGSPSATKVNRIRYFLSGGVLYKGVVVPSGVQNSYNLASETVTSVVRGIVSTSSIFAYYDNTYAGTSTPLVQPVNVTQIAFVRLNLMLGQQEVRASSSTYSFTAGAAVRSLKTNLGN